MEKFRIVTAYFRFLIEQKKWWMFPTAFLLLILGLLITLTQGSPLAPFIYTVF